MDTSQAITMSPKKTGNGNLGDAPAFTDRDAKMAILALKQLPPTAKTSLNFQVFVSEFGQKDTKSAKECFRQLCKKHGWFEGGAVCLPNYSKFYHMY